jgi:hypothetical protein
MPLFFTINLTNNYVILHHSIATLSLKILTPWQNSNPDLLRISNSQFSAAGLPRFQDSEVPET